MEVGETLFDDLDTAEQKTEDGQEPEDDNGSSSGAYRWAHFPAMIVFAALIIPLHRHPWGWQIAIASGYTVYVFWFALGLGVKNSDDFFGDSQVPLYTAKLLIPHTLILIMIVLGVSEWFHLKTVVPSWVTHEGRKESIWDLFGWLLLAGAGIWQGFWMGNKIKHRFSEPEDSSVEN